MKKLLLAALSVVLCLLTHQAAFAAPDYFFEGKALAHPVVSGGDNNTSLLAFLKEADGVNLYYCFCDDIEVPEDRQRKLDSFGNADIRSVFFYDMDGEGPITLVLGKRNNTNILRAYRYQENTHYFYKMGNLQKVLDRIASTSQKLDAITVKRALAKLTPLDYSVNYNITGVPEFDAIDHSLGTLVGFFDKEGRLVSQTANNTTWSYKKTFAQKNDLFLTVTYVRSPFREEAVKQTYRVGRITWEADPKQFTGTENGKYNSFDMSCCEISPFEQGQYKNGVRVGNWTYDVGEFYMTGPYANGKRNGVWVQSGMDYTVTGKMVDDMREGRWTFSDDRSEFAISGFETYLHDVLHGPTERYMSGVLHYKGTYRQGQFDGHWITEDSEGSYVDGKRQGMWKFIKSDGSIQTGPYNNDKPDGEFRITEADGRPRVTEFYRQGLRWGPRMQYNAKGQVITRTEFVNNQEVRELVYFDNGSLWADRSKKDGQLDGAYLYNFSNGKPKFVGNYERGSKIGKHMTYFENGQVEREENYCRFTPDKGVSRIGYCGRQQTFDKEGRLLRDYDYLFDRKQIDNTYYVNGARQTETVPGTSDRVTLNEYYANGQLKCTYPRQGYEAFKVDGRDYKDSRGAKREGTAICYYEDGVVERQATYVNNMMQGCWTKFDRTGKQTFPPPEGCPKPKPAFFVFE